MISTRLLKLSLLAAILSTAILSPHTAAALSRPETLQQVQQRYFWLDEIRTIAHAWSTAETGAVAQWPAMTVSAGSGDLPLPAVDIAPATNARLDDPAWSQATTFPVGPLFDDWRDGPFMLQVSVCRHESNVYVAIESPRNLTDLATAAGTPLFTINGKHHGGAIATVGQGQIIELSAPADGKVTLSFNTELIRRTDGKPGDEITWLGLDKHKNPVWMGPVVITLSPADVSVRLFPKINDAGETELNAHMPRTDSATSECNINLNANLATGITSYHYNGAAGKSKYSLKGFFYREPTSQIIATSRQMLTELAETSDDQAYIESTRKDLDALHGSLPQADSIALRAVYCSARTLRASIHRRLLDAPLLFVKRHPYYAGHIYDDYLTWRPGGGIYMLKNPSDALEAHKVSAVIDPDTMDTLGDGVYRDPDLSWDAKRIVFAHKPLQNGDTSLHEIDVDGAAMRRLTDPASDCTDERPVRALGAGRHDITPAYLPDGRIVFTSTRPAGRVPCFNSEVDILHIMNGDGTGLKWLSVNNVNEFDPAVLNDGRILYGRWEYVDKTALYMQSLWTMAPDGTGETALFANNTAKPTAVLDARPVPGTGLVAAALTPHNGQAVGAIAIIDPRRGKNDLAAVTNFTPEYPVKMDQGLRDGPCDPWPLSSNDIVFANNAIGGHGIVEIVDRRGHRDLVYADQHISCFAPMLVKPRPKPLTVADITAKSDTGTFLVRDIYRGLKGVEPGEVKYLRIIEETTRTSGIPGGGRWWNQAFLVSWQGAYVVKNILGVVPVHPDGSAYFEVPAGRAIYLQALDAKGREIQRMRTFVQAAPGVTRSCIGCHESKMSAPANSTRPIAQRTAPAKPQPESWGSGFVDYPTMVQPILNRHCVKCHGGEKMSAGLDLSGGWTWAFNISYETLLKNNLAGFIRCHNSDTTSSDILAPRTIGSGVAPLADVLLSGHKGRIGDVSNAERDVILAWMDLNSSYYGTWNWTEHATCNAILEAGSKLSQVMNQAGCTDCHSGPIGNDWINLERPAYSRILRAPLKKTNDNNALAFCRNRKAPAGYLPLVTQQNLPPDVFRPPTWPKHDRSGEVHATFESTDNQYYSRMLDIITRARLSALNDARVDIPGARINPGMCRHLYPPQLPAKMPKLTAITASNGTVELSWDRSGQTIGLSFDLYRSTNPQFALDDATALQKTTMFRYADLTAPAGPQHYALVASSKTMTSPPVYASVTVPVPKPPQTPARLNATALPGEIALTWTPPQDSDTRFNVYRAPQTTRKFSKLTAEPILASEFTDIGLSAEATYSYHIRAVSSRGVESNPCDAVTTTPLPEQKEPVFFAPFTDALDADTFPGGKVQPKSFGRPSITDGLLTLTPGSYLTYPYSSTFDLRARLSLECWVYLDNLTDMPIIVGCGRWNDRGWFLQKLGGSLRWHLGGVDCDGGKALEKQWMHLVGTFDGKTAKLYQDGKQVGSIPCAPNMSPWRGPLHIGQYSGGVGPQYQVQGKIASVRIYRRALAAGEIAESFNAGR